MAKQDKKFHYSILVFDSIKGEWIAKLRYMDESGAMVTRAMSYLTLAGAVKWIHAEINQFAVAKVDAFLGASE